VAVAVIIPVLVVLAVVVRLETLGHQERRTPVVVVELLLWARLALAVPVL
jgi:hypothetical protein